MALAVPAKNRFRITVCFLFLVCLVFCGCTPAPLLSQREIVHAVFFQKQGSTNRVLLLLADSTQSAENKSPAYRTVSGRGRTPAQSLDEAESKLAGQVFYGLLDLAVLPAECDWQQIQDLGRLLYEKTKPSPQITVLLMDSSDSLLEENASALYTDMENACERYGIKNGLQQLFSQEKECALPVWQGTGYGFMFLQENQANIIISEPLAAQICAVLCGQGNRINTTFLQGNAALQAQAVVRHEAGDLGINQLRLVLSDLQIQNLQDSKQETSLLQNELCSELQRAFSELIQQIYTSDFDPLRTKVWFSAVHGVRAQPTAPRLSVCFEP